MVPRPSSAHSNPRHEAARPEALPDFVHSGTTERGFSESPLVLGPGKAFSSLRLLSTPILMLPFHFWEGGCKAQAGDKEQNGCWERVSAVTLARDKPVLGEGHGGVVAETQSRGGRGRLGSHACPVTHRPRAKEVAKPQFPTRKTEIRSSGFSALVWAPRPRASGPCGASLGTSPRSGRSAGRRRPGQPGVLEKCLGGGGRLPSRFPPARLPSPRVLRSSVPGLPREVRGRASLGISSGCRCLSPSSAGDSNAAVTSPPPSKARLPRAAGLGGWGGPVAPGTDDRPVAPPQVCDRLGAVLARRAPPQPSLPAGPPGRQHGRARRPGGPQTRAGTPGLAAQPIGARGGASPGPGINRRVSPARAPLCRAN